MELEEFSTKLNNMAKKMGIELKDEEVSDFYKYMNLLIKWNENVNLTAITEPNDIIVKHFIDSLTIQKYITKKSAIIDIGTGAGFPGVPIGIINSDCNVTLMDSLNKRIKFLNEVITTIKIDMNVKAIHARAEELAKNIQYREKYDIATSRAVASLNVLLEYMLPFVKVGGYAICMKGSNVDDEVMCCKKALSVLGGSIEKIDSFTLPGTDFARNIVVVKKVRKTSSKYPRKAGMPTKEPIA